MAGSTRSTVALVAAAVLVAGLTTVIVLVRAGGDPADAATWPITWELRSSDNGVLFQFMQDVVAGRPLDWSFSPQVFVFPELPISALAFALSGGSIAVFYVVVAALQNVLLLLALVALARVLFPDHGAAAAVLRGSIALLPLLVFPLIGTSWILSFHLAPTYYIGMYLALLAAPVVVLARHRPARIVLGVALAVTAASNPLALLFAAPGTAAALLLLVIRRGWRRAREPVVTVGGLLVLALLLRLLFTPLQGTSPFTYVDAEVFAGRLAAIGPYYAFQARDPAAAFILGGGVVLAVGCLAGAVLAAARYLRGGPHPDRRLLAVVMLGMIPLGGLAATYLMMITHYYYFWPVLILPWVLALLAVPRFAHAPAVVAGAGALLVVAVSTGLPSQLTQVDRYLTFRTDETVCLDESVPGATGYATFSDARRLSLPSHTGVRLIQLTTDLDPNTWLTNRAYARTEPGSFFYVNGSGDELELDTGRLADLFGEPDREIGCSGTQRILVYDDPAKLERIATHYRG